MGYKPLKISGYRGLDVRNSFFESDPAAEHLAVVFPGLRYTADMPAVYYPALVMRARGADVLSIQNDYTIPEYQNGSQEEQARWLAADGAAALQAAMAAGRYRKLTLIGKSLGTITLGTLLASDPSLEKADFIWLTPVLRDESVRRMMGSRRHHGLFVIGTADFFYEPRLWAEVLAASGGEGLILEGADHSLEIPGDAAGSIRAMETVVRKIEEFVR